MATVTKEMREAQLKNRKDFQETVEHQQEVATEAKMTVRATRKLVLAGTRHREKVPTPELGEGAYLVLRPVTDEEFTQMTATILKGIPMPKKGESVDKSLAGIVEKEATAKYALLSYALSVDGQKWTPKDVASLPPGVPDRLFNVEAKISGFPTKLPFSLKKPQTKPTTTEENGSASRQK